jgi:DNA-binding NarL/FixJ family response regulator
VRAILLNNMGKIKVLFLDQREIIRYSIYSLFKNDPDIEMVIRFDRIANWPDLVEKYQPDLVIIDVGYTGTAIVRKIKQKHSNQNILAITDIPEESEFREVFQSGVKAYFKTGDLNAESLKAAIKFSIKDLIVLPRRFSVYLSFEENKRSNSGLSVEEIDQSTRLSDQEKAIIALIMLGASNRVIADFLHISENTAKVHLRNIMGKLGVKGKQKLALFVRTHHHLRNELLIDYNYIRDKIPHDTQ